MIGPQPSIVPVVAAALPRVLWAALGAKWQGAAGTVRCMAPFQVGLLQGRDWPGDAIHTPFWPVAVSPPGGGRLLPRLDRLAYA